MSGTLKKTKKLITMRLVMVHQKKFGGYAKKNIHGRRKLKIEEETKQAVHFAQIKKLEKIII